MLHRTYFNKHLLLQVFLSLKFLSPIFRFIDFFILKRATGYRKKKQEESMVT